MANFDYKNTGVEGLVDKTSAGYLFGEVMDELRSQQTKRLKNSKYQIPLAKKGNAKLEFAVGQIVTSTGKGMIKAGFNFAITQAYIENGHAKYLANGATFLTGDIADSGIFNIGVTLKELRFWQIAGKFKNGFTKADVKATKGLTLGTLKVLVEKFVILKVGHDTYKLNEFLGLSEVL